MKKNFMTRMLAMVLVLCTMIMAVPVPAFAAEPFSTIEVFGSKDRTYITVKENVPLRASPSNKALCSKSSLKTIRWKPKVCSALKREPCG